MNRRQRVVITEFVAVVVITAVAVFVVLNVKDVVNRSEAMRAMQDLGQRVMAYRNQNRSLPPESFIVEIEDELTGNARLGRVTYRALWISFEATGDEILAYRQINYRSLFVGKGYVVLRLDGQVEWMKKQQFEELLAHQQTQREIEMLHKQPDQDL